MLYTQHMQNFKNPVINALSASAYIGLVVTLLNFVSQAQANKPDTAFAPVAFLSLFTLSAAVMAYLFFYQPLMLFIEGKKKESVRLFVRTLGVFAAFTAVVWMLLLAGLI